VHGPLLDCRRKPEDRPIDLDALVADPLAPAVAGLAAVALLLVISLVVLARSVRRQSRRIDRLTRGSNDQGLEAVLDAHLDTVARALREVDELEARAGHTEAALRRSLQRVGLVRYNPFDDTGGNQSFALALVDGNADGIVVSSLHARAGTRVYAKALSAGRADAAMSAEETEALRRAIDTAGPRVPGAGPTRA
jgi:Protein of unknown function (DUF4446)